MSQHLFTAFILTALAGLSTGIGSLIAFVTKHTNKTFLSVSLGFSAGVMIYVSMIEIFPTAQTILTKAMDKKSGSWLTVLAFFGGMLLIAIIDKLIPSEENPHEIKTVEEEDQKPTKLMRMGLMTAIAIHNIPEGIAVSVPIYQATGSKKKAFTYSFLSGLAEPLGAIIGWFLLMPIMNNIVYGAIFSAVAGIMVFISLDELLPAAEEYGKHHLAIYGVISGMLIMAVSLLLFI